MKKRSRNPQVPSGHKLYSVWVQMRQRCYNEKCPEYKNYGGRGIAVCKRWVRNYSTFYKWAIKKGYSEGLNIDRINVNGNYTPINCRFVDNATSLRNKRNVIKYEYNGEEKCISEWSKYFGVNRQTLRQLLKNKNMPLGEAVDFIKNK